MLLTKLLFVSLFLCISVVKAVVFINNASQSEILDSHISSVINYLNAKPNKVYDYKKGSLIHIQNRADVFEVTVAIDVDCINKYPEVPCNEKVLICHALIGRDSEQNPTYQVLSDVRCSPKNDEEVTNIPVNTVEITSNSPLLTENVPNNNGKIELSNEAISPEQIEPDFIARPRPELSCLGCPHDLNKNVEGVTELLETALRHIESEQTHRYAVVEVKRLQQQIVNGVKYILLIEVVPTVCQKDADISAPCPSNTNENPFTCEITFIEHPWIKKEKHIIGNNCTRSQEFATASKSTNSGDDTQNEISKNTGASVTNPDQWLTDLQSQILPENPSSPTPTRDNDVKALENSLADEGNNQFFTDIQSQILPETRVIIPRQDIEIRRSQSMPASLPNLPYIPDQIYAQWPRDIHIPKRPDFTRSQSLPVESLTPFIRDFDEFKSQPLYSQPNPFLYLIHMHYIPEKSTQYHQNEELSREHELNVGHIIHNPDWIEMHEAHQRRLRRSTSKSESSNTEETQRTRRDIVKSSEESSEISSEEILVDNNRSKRDIVESESNSNSTSSEENGRPKRGAEDSSDSSSSSEENDTKAADTCQKCNNKDNEDSSSSSSSSSSSNKNDQVYVRNERSTGQMEKISHEEKGLVRDLASFAAATLDSIDDDHHKRVILQILGAKKLKLDGLYYQIILRLGISHCFEGDHHESCREKLFTNLTKICKVLVHVDEDYSNPKVVKSQCQNIKKDENDRNRTNYSRYKRTAEAMVGAPRPFSKDSPNVQTYLQAALEHLDSTNSDKKHEVVNIVSATHQVVSGAKYVITADIGLSETTQTPKRCVVVVWEQLWLDSRKYTVTCDSDVYKFNTKAKSFKKRSTSLLGVDKEMPVDHPDVRKYVDIMMRYLSSKISKNTKYANKRINSASKRILSGTFWNINVDIVQCPKEKTCSDNVNFINCDLEVLNRVWLLDSLNMQLTCSNDDHVYTYRNVTPLKAELAFTRFVKEYSKDYNNYEEYQYRLKVFKQNLAKIHSLNKMEEGTAEYGITKFADLTEAEFSKLHGYRPDLQSENELPFMNADIPDVKIPSEFDWRNKKAVTEIKDQGMCGSCWAFSVTGNVEGQYAIKYGKLLEFSEQELVDCDKSDQGCNGGLMDNAYRAIESMGGLETESDYPYEGEDETCRLNTNKTVVNLKGAVNISQDETDMAKWLVQNGPISIAINANAMQFYMGGISHPIKILCNPNNLDHGVLIVGYGVHTYKLFNKTLPYWIVKNSWGTSWGEQGYYRVYRGDGTCGLNQTPSSAIVA
ncbi:uncharacterized protein LOC143201400 isoform X2 [Rhynchophorus ferrugineus]|uniref:uncharacterized protein LOC143201400 isoform X2 n=1 Tax=Rhynchophorus ferrugineus TaxID=354439 RepID=UPI003FCDD021